MFVRRNIYERGGASFPRSLDNGIVPFLVLRSTSETVTPWRAPPRCHTPRCRSGHQPSGPEPDTHLQTDTQLCNKQDEQRNSHVTSSLQRLLTSPLIGRLRLLDIKVMQCLLQDAECFALSNRPQTSQQVRDRPTWNLQDTDILSDLIFTRISRTWRNSQSSVLPSGGRGFNNFSHCSDTYNLTVAPSASETTITAVCNNKRIEADLMKLISPSK